MPTFDLENGFPGIVAGIDEVGRGPLCGPVYAACVVLDRVRYPQRVDDSKKISRVGRERIFNEVLELERNGLLRYGIGIVEPEEVDRINVRNATKVAMALAFLECTLKYDARIDTVLVDGDFVPDISAHALAIVKGDGKSYSIACASVVAKVLRDWELDFMDVKHPHYGWRKNKGYATREHLEAIERHGLVENYHRKSFCRRFLS
ncbi:MAG: ribonuclease HII [Rickettsiales bacterium]|jgi:ribonuclease HII|nr:ribonuclease HII [Rickettsiales bacterium]